MKRSTAHTTMVLQASTKVLWTAKKYTKKKEERLEFNTEKKTSLSSNISNKKNRCLITFSNTEKRVENATLGRVFLRYFEVFANVVKTCVECLI